MKKFALFIQLAGFILLSPLALAESPDGDSLSVVKSTQASMSKLIKQTKVNVTAVVANEGSRRAAAYNLLQQILKHYKCQLPTQIDEVHFGVLSGGSSLDHPGEFYSGVYATYCVNNPTINGFEDEGTNGFLTYEAIASDWCEQLNCNFVYSASDRSFFYIGRLPFSQFNPLPQPTPAP